jgi:hypothetical protein
MFMIAGLVSRVVLNVGGYGFLNLTRNGKEESLQQEESWGRGKSTFFG